jgi:hypothetical protein
VIDLTSALSADGTLTWDAPAGNWTVMRFGMSPTGITNHPAAPNATGFEVDKMNRNLAAHHFDAFVGMVLSRLGPAERKAVKFVAVDSYEVGSQNWTDGNRRSFEKSFGYDPLPWLPALSGRVVRSAAESNRFLWDLRRHIADRISYDYAGGLAEAAHKAGIQLWLQNYGHWGFPGEFMQYGGRADMLSGEFWAAKTLGEIECRAAASTSHAYGKPVVYGEAFTSLGFFESHPYSLKARGDWAYTIGVNHLVIQVTMHQPDERKPGVNAWFGTEFNRHNTWYAQGRAWSDYMSRCNFLLRQGCNVADVAYFIGEDTPAMTGPTEPQLPAGYGFDYINAEVLQERVRVKDGRFVLPDGTSYRLLVLPALTTMRPALLERIGQLVKEGGAILGSAPAKSPSLQGFPQSDERVAQLAREIWNGTGKYGRGRVIGGADLAAALRTVGVSPAIRDLDPQKTLWIHRSTPESEIFFVSNQTDENVVLTPTFRAEGAPELWDPVTGSIVSTARHRQRDGGTQVTLPLGPSGSMFVVFPATGGDPRSVAAVSRDGNADHRTVVERDAQGFVARIAANGRYQFTTGTGTIAHLDVRDIPPPLVPATSWQVRFPPGMDVPTQVEMPRLISWTEHNDEAVRHFSGTGVYHNDIDVPAPWLRPGRRVFLELGKVEVIADVRINGKRVGTAWLPPYRLDVTDALKPGTNRVEVETTNLWRNRIIGDMRFPDAFPGTGQGKQFKTELFTYGGWDKKPVLFPSGLLGPVTLQVVQDYRVRP